jgi:flagellar biosynthesis GTPase FlhF
MNLKRFRGETVREALERPRGELGPDALVLSTQLVPASGWRGVVGGREVEVITAIDREVSDPRPELQVGRRPESQAVSALAARLEAAGFAAAVAREVKPARGMKGRRSTSAEWVRQSVTEWATPYVANDDGDGAVDVFIGPPGTGQRVWEDLVRATPAHLASALPGDARAESAA